MLNFICKLSKGNREKYVELLDTDATGCSVTGNNCGGERSIF